MNPIILHIGGGSFHRAHQACYLQQLRQHHQSPWSITIGNIRPDLNDTLNALIDQNGKYTLETVTPTGERAYELIESITQVLPWSSGCASLIKVGSSAQCKIVSFTVTEGGYYQDGHEKLDVTNADLAKDLEGGCTTIYGVIAAIINERMKSYNNDKLTFQCCDNVRSNGDRFKAGMLEFLSLRGLNDAASWMISNTTCPNAMVDRITPRPTSDVRERVRLATNMNDAVPVMAESFIQWVIEDNFIAGRPDWQLVGVEMVSSVHSHEEAKIRLLNATHSCIAWAGALKGLNYIHESIADHEICQFARDYIRNDAIPCLTAPFDLFQYSDMVIARFGNVAIHDTNQRVCADGYSKIPGFILPTIRECLNRKMEPNSTVTIPALFFRYLERWHRNELPHVYQDGVMDPAVAHSYFTSEDPLKAFMSDNLLWGSLAENVELERLVRTALITVDNWLEHNKQTTPSTQS